MKTLKINQQKPADSIWKDENGMQIPYSRVKNYERMYERKLPALAKTALDINKRLTAFKADVKNTALELYDAFLKDNDGKAPGKGKGGITMFTFDRSIKVEVDVHDNITLDENFIGLAKAEFDELLKTALVDAKDFIEPIVTDAFETSGGRLDHKKVLGLKRHAHRITDERFHKALGYIDKAIRRVSTTEYFKISVQAENGQYHNIQLNFAKIILED